MATIAPYHFIAGITGPPARLEYRSFFFLPMNAVAGIFSVVGPRPAPNRLITRLSLLYLTRTPALYNLLLTLF